MSMELRILKATLSDLDDVAPLFDAYRRFYGRNDEWETSHTFVETRLRAEDSAIFVARNFENGQAVGFAQLYPTLSSVWATRIWTLNDLFVASEARRFGVAKRLMDAAEAFGRSSGAPVIVLQTAENNHTARRLYESRGYVLDSGFCTYEMNL